MREPTIEADNFELKPTLITMVQQHQFTGHPIEDPNEHMGRFMRMANTVKWGQTGSDQVATVFIFTARCGSILV